MTLLKEFVPYKKCEGKTVQYAGNYINRRESMCVLLSFSDDTYTHVEVSQEYDIYGNGGEFLDINDTPLPIDTSYNGSILVSAGLTTQEELDKYEKEQRERMIAEDRDKEIQEYLRLHVKYKDILSPDAPRA